jgi:hypothetical protein
VIVRKVCIATLFRASLRCCCFVVSKHANGTFAFEIAKTGPPRVRPAERDGPRRCAEEEEGWSATAERVVIRSEVGGD